MALSDDEKEILKNLNEQAKIRAKINGSLAGYMEVLRDISSAEKELAEKAEYKIKLNDELADATRRNNKKDIDAATAKLNVLKHQTDEINRQLGILKTQVKEAKKFNLLTGASMAAMVKGFSKLPGLIRSGYGQIKGTGLFEMDKAIKMSALEMGLLGKQSESYTATIREAAITTNDLGIGVAELAKMQSSYSNELGRTVMLGKEGLIAMSQIASATGLGAEGTAKMAADMENQGYSALKVSKFVEQTMNDASKMGLNASKVIKNIQGNIKMLNKYNFKGGAKGLAKMAELTSKLGVSMEFATGMADKLFDIEGAVDMSAQLQVMGGEWAKLADPFKLMYMARNDMEGLTEAIGQAAASAAHFNEKTGDFDISSLEMHRLRKVAEQMGVSYEELAQAAKNAAKFTKIKGQIGFDMSKEAKEFITTTAQLENGKAFIEVGGEKKFLNQMGSEGKKLIEQQMLEKKNLAERAKASQTFDDKLTNLINMMKTTMLPIVDGITEVLGPLVDGLIKDKKFIGQMKELGHDIAGLVKTGAEIVKGVAKFAIWLGPMGSLAVLLGAKGLMSAASWIANGVALATGFNMGTMGVMGSLKMMGGVLLKLLGPLAAIAGGTWLGGKASEAVGNESTTAGTVAGLSTGALAALATGILFTPVTGGMSLAAAVALAGAGGAIAGKMGGDALSQPVHDAVSAGSDFSQGRGIIQGGKITPIDNKDSLIAYKPKGPIDNAMNNNSPKTMKIEFGEIHFKFDDLKVVNSNGEKVSIELLKDPAFIRNITRMVHNETDKVIQGGKPKG